jgi:hypothetical protein
VLSAKLPDKRRPLNKAVMTNDVANYDEGVGFLSLNVLSVLEHQIDESEYWTSNKPEVVFRGVE